MLLFLQRSLMLIQLAIVPQSVHLLQIDGLLGFVLISVVFHVTALVLASLRFEEEGPVIFIPFVIVPLGGREQHEAEY